MARTPVTDRPAISQWLIRARESHGMTQPDFLAALRAETGSMPDPATYSQWESGRRTPKDASLAPVVAFWGARGVAPLAYEPAPSAPSLEERAVIAAERQADAAEAQVELLSQLVAHLTGETPVAPGTSERVAAFLAGVAARSRQPADPPTPPARS